MGTVVAVTSSDIQRSTDGGATWTTVYTDSTGDGLNDVVAAGGSAWVVLTGSALLRSTDDGVNWSPVSLPTAPRRGGAANGSTVIIGTNDAATVLRSTDSGETFSTVVIGDSDTDSEYPTGIGYANGYWVVSTACGIYRSSDDGATWSSVKLQEDNGLVDASVAYGNGVWIVQNYYGLHRSTDDGASWAAVTGIFTGTIPDDVYVSPGLIRYGGGVWVCYMPVSDYSTATKYFLRSTDDGVTWDSISLDHGWIDGLAYLGPAWLVVAEPTTAPFTASTFSSTDGGVTWSSVSTAAGFLSLAAASGASPTGAFYVYNPDTDAWTQLDDGPVVSHAGSVVAGGKLYVLGGRKADGSYSAELHVYDPDAATWTQLTSTLGAISDPSLTEANGNLYVLGAEQDLDGTYALIPHVWIYSITDDTWSTSQDLDVPHTAGGACQVLDYLYAVGGLVDGYHDHEAAIDGAAGADSLYSDVLTVWMSPPSPISTFTDGGSGGGWGPLAV